MPERPPKKWFNMMKGKVTENPKYKGYGVKRISKIVAGIWYDYTDRTRKALTKKFEGGKKKMGKKTKKKAKKGKKWGKIGAPHSAKRKKFLAKARKKKGKSKK